MVYHFENSLVFRDFLSVYETVYAVLVKIFLESFLFGSNVLFINWRNLARQKLYQTSSFQSSINYFLT